jgi:hypothetical protein
MRRCVARTVLPGVLPSFSRTWLNVPPAKCVGSGLRLILQGGKGAGHDNLSG